MPIVVEGVQNILGVGRYIPGIGVRIDTGLFEVLEPEAAAWGSAQSHARKEQIKE